MSRPEEGHIKEGRVEGDLMPGSAAGGRGISFWVFLRVLNTDA